MTIQGFSMVHERLLPFTMNTRLSCYRYSAARREIRKAFQVESDFQTHDSIVRYRILEGPYKEETLRASVYHDADNNKISIGCMRFFDKDYARLKRWAFAKTAKKSQKSSK